jgi:hypothetical protein
MARKICCYHLTSACDSKTVPRRHWKLAIGLLARLEPMCEAAQRLSKITDRKILSEFPPEVTWYQARAIGRVLGMARAEDIDAVKEELGCPCWNTQEMLHEIGSVGRFFAWAGSAGSAVEVLG